MSGEALLDVVLVLVLVGYAWSGWRQGFVSALLGLVGLVAGAFLAVRLVPGWLEDSLGLAPSTPGGVLALLAAVLAGAVAGQSLMLVLARRVRESVEAPSARALDSALGLVAVLAAAVLVIWVVAGAVRVGGPPAARDLMARSAVVTALDEVVPPSADGLVEDVTKALDRSGFPRVFEGLGPEPIAPVDAPDDELATDPEVARALGSVVRVLAESRTCDAAQVGTGWVVAPGRVATNAHVVAGADRVGVSLRGTGREREARVVAFDPRRDVAVLAVPGLDAPSMPRGEPLDTGDPAVLAGFPGDEGLWVGSARVRDVLTARGADIHGGTGVVREVYSLRAQVRRGASGGPVVDPSGRVVGMIFATSLDDPDTGYALTLDEIDPVLDRGTASSAPVATGACTSG
ncbi:acid resistance serine protease MarP [Fodinibacter luteus]|uniref:Acid resistance serine protease MarP n=1 Tax=Fodinibacter luteus TaxID=552064 RepID=A0ABP8K4R8_9MICO